MGEECVRVSIEITASELLTRAFVHGAMGVIPRPNRSPVADPYRRAYNRGGVSCRGEPAVNRVDPAEVSLLVRLPKEAPAESADAAQPLRFGHGDVVFLCHEAVEELSIVACRRDRPGLWSMGACDSIRAPCSCGASPGNTGDKPRSA